jgi:hypothetical protein
MDTNAVIAAMRSEMANTDPLPTFNSGSYFA